MSSLNDAKVLGITLDHNYCDDNCACEEQEIPKYLYLYLPSTKKLNPAWVISQLKKEGYTLLEEYINVNTPIMSLCPNGHKYKVRWANFNKGQRCRECYLATKFKDSNYVEDQFKKEGYKLIDSYKDARTPMRFVCPKGHEHKISWNSFRNGLRCAYCSKYKKPISNNMVKEAFESEGYILLGNYIKCHIPMEIICPKGHKHRLSWKSFIIGRRCVYCRLGKYKHTQEEIENLFLREGYVVLSDYTRGCETPLKVRCPNGHLWETTYTQFYHNKTRCGVCFMEKLKGCTNIKARHIYKKVKLYSRLESSKLKDICNGLYSDALWSFYNNTPPGHNVDHIIPCSWLSMDDPEQIKLCWSLDNLQYLSATKNMRKSNNLTLRDLQSLTPTQINILKSATNIPKRHQAMVMDFLSGLEDAETWFWTSKDTYENL
jgi:hypothetical protein